MYGQNFSFHLTKIINPPPPQFHCNTLDAFLLLGEFCNLMMMQNKATEDDSKQSACSHIITLYLQAQSSLVSTQGLYLTNHPIKHKICCLCICHCCIERERRPVARNFQVCQVVRDLFQFGPIGSLAFVSSQSFL